MRLAHYSIGNSLIPAKAGIPDYDLGDETVLVRYWDGLN